MILHAIELRHVGCFRGTVRAGDFAPGLNVLSAPNESGKSTLLRAAARALFDRHTTKSDEIKALQPAGTDLPPSVAVEFETGGETYRIEKTFLRSARSLLQRRESGVWQPIAEADGADARLQTLMKSALPGRGATRPEHWGLLGFLWARQGEPTEWPQWESGETGERIRHQLARVELDPVIEKWLAALGRQGDAILTSQGKAKRDGELDRAEAELERIESEMDDLANKKTALEDCQKVFRECAATVTRLEAEERETRQKVDDLRARAVSAEAARKELDQRTAELERAQEKLQAADRDLADFLRWQSELLDAQTALRQSDEAVEKQRGEQAALAEKIEAAQAEQAALAGRVEALQERQRRIRALLKLEQCRAEAAALRLPLERALQADSRLAGLLGRQRETPRISPAQLQEMEALEESIRTLGAQVLTSGISVRLEPERDAAVRVGAAGREERLPGGEARVFHSPQSLELSLGGWGRVSVRSGAQEARELEAALAKARAALQARLAEARAGGVEEARGHLATHRQLDGEIRAERARLGDLLGTHRTLEQLRTAVREAQNRGDFLEQQLAAKADESLVAMPSRAELEAEEAALLVSLEARYSELKTLENALAGNRAEERRRHAESEVLAKRHHALQNRRSLLEASLHGLLRRHGAENADANFSTPSPSNPHESMVPEAWSPRPLADGKAAAQVVFVNAEARAAAARAGLPADFASLPGRMARAAGALRAVEEELRRQRRERDSAEGSLKTLGGLGLYSRESELEERRAVARLRRDRARLAGWAARVCRGVLERRRQAATRAVLEPLEGRLSAEWASLTGVAGRRVFLDETLGICGVGRSREEAHAFGLLSQGAKELLLLCLRLAVARELAEGGERQLLILDDTLVNTDPARQERVLDLLGEAAGRLQILVLTCHPGLWRGAGHAVALAEG